MTSQSDQTPTFVTRTYLNDAYQYGLDTQEFDADLANVALDEVDRRLKSAIQAAIQKAEQEAHNAAVDACIREVRKMQVDKAGELHRRLVQLQRPDDQPEAA